MKNKPSLTKEITVLEQNLVEKLEILETNTDIHGILSDHLNRVLKTVESARHELERQIPNIQQIREFLQHQVSCKIEENTAVRRQVQCFSNGHPFNWRNTQSNTPSSQKQTAD